MHALLNDNKEEDVLCVQEPWFNPVGTARCDTMYQGKDVLGGAANPKWRLAYPSFTNGQRAKVMIYVRIHDWTHIFRKDPCQMIVRNDLASHPCLLITDFRISTYYWRVLNFYNDTADPSVTDLQGPPSERTQTEKIRDLKSLARQYARDQESCDDTRISYLEFVEMEAEADLTLARMITG
jgi:hypothetical protein